MTQANSKTAILLSISQLAAETGMTRETVSKRLDRAGTVAAGKRSTHPVYRLRDALKALYANLGDASEDGEPKFADPNARLSSVKADLLTLKLGEEKARLIPVEEVTEESARVMKLVEQTLSIIPDVLERDAGLEPRRIEVVQREIDKLRVNLNDEIAAEPEVDEDLASLLQ